MNAIRTSAKAIIVRDGCLLAVRSVDVDGDWYLLPGGGQNPGETLVEALRRECVEEIGAHIEIGDLIAIREYIGRNHEFAHEDGEVHQVEHMFACSIDPSYTPASGSAPDTFQTGVAWLPLAELERHRLYPSVLRTILRDGVRGLWSVYLGDVN